MDALEKEDFFILSSVSIEELEDIKTNRSKDDDVKYRARKAVRFLNEHPEKYKIIVYGQWDRTLYPLDPIGRTDNLTNDDKIIHCACFTRACCGYDDLIFASDDILARLIAENRFGLDVIGLNNQEEEIYTGYKIIEGNTNTINEYMSSLDNTEWNINEYLIIKNLDDLSTKEMRFDGEKFLPLKLPPSKFIKAKNSLQRCALDILMNPNITIAAILGGFGSGKTFLCMQMALYNVIEKGNHSKIIGIREPHGEGKEVGFLPGSFQDKTDLFFQPLAQQLHGGEIELESLKLQGVLESNIPYYLKGTTYNNSILLVDEAEDLTKKQIRLIGTRLGSNSKVFFSGDYKQSVIDTSTNNALVEMCNTFKGNEKFGCIYLDEDVRSETSKMFADLFTNK